jgi:hypothetical protein
MAPVTCLKMVIRPKLVAVTEQNIQTSVALDGNPEPTALELITVGKQGPGK